MVSPLPPPEEHENPGTPLERFIAAIGLIVLLSVPIATVTLLHRAEGIQRLRPGDPMPALSLRSVDSAEVSVLRMDEKGAVLLFFSIECPRCRQEISNFDKLFRTFNDRFVFAGISSGNAQDTKKFLDQREIMLPVYLDDNAEARKALGVTEVPTLFLVKANGVISYRGSGVETLKARRRLLADFVVDEGR